MSMNNESGLKPVGVSVLVLPDQVEKTTSSGIVVSTDENADREQLRQTDGVVIDISANAFYDEPPRCQVGDRVIMAAFAGMVREGADGKKYRLIRDHDIVAVITKEKEKK